MKSFKMSCTSACCTGMTLVRVDRCLMLMSSPPDAMASTTWAQSSEWHCVGSNRYTAKSTPKCIPERTTNLLHIRVSLIMSSYSLTYLLSYLLPYNYYHYLLLLLLPPLPPPALLQPNTSTTTTTTTYNYYHHHYYHKNYYYHHYYHLLPLLRYWT